MEGRLVGAFGYNFWLRAGVAQLVEQRIRNAKVEGSTPSTGTIDSISYTIKTGRRSHR
jgi:hypothetical protein